MKKFVFKSAFLLLVSLFAFSLVTRSATAVNYTVSPAGMQDWEFASDGLGYSHDFVSGPAGSGLLGSGSLRLSSGNDGGTFTEVKNDTDFTALRLDQINSLSYSTNASQWGTSNKLPVMILEVDNTVDGGLGDRLIFDTRNNTSQATPALNQWQNWNVKDGVFTTNFAGNKTLSEYIGIFPNATISSTGIRMGVGMETQPEVFVASVDNFSINGDNYDFEPNVVVPTNNYQQSFFTGDFGAPVGTPGTYTPTGVPNMGGFSWGMGSPGAGVPVNNFSARWTGTFNFENAIYRFVGNTNNGNDTIRVFVDGVLRVERKPGVIFPMPPSPYVHTNTMVAHGAMVPMTAGVHEVTVEYVHTTGSSNPKWSFWKPADCRDINADGIVNSGDQGLMARFLGQIPSFVDQNGDNVTNSGDQGLMAIRLGQTCPYN